MGLPNVGGKFARKRIRKKQGVTKGRRIKGRKNLSKSGSVLNHGRSVSRNAIIAFTDPGR